MQGPRGGQNKSLLMGRHSVGNSEPCHQGSCRMPGLGCPMPWGLSHGLVSQASTLSVGLGCGEAQGLSFQGLNCLWQGMVGM